MPLVRYTKASLSRTRVRSWERRNDEPVGPGLRVLLYHRLASDSDSLALRPSRFHAQMAHLAEQGYRGVDLNTGLDELYSGTLEPHTIAITFDDGFCDVVDNGLRALAEHSFTATVFIATSVIDRSASYGRRQPPVLTWDDIVRIEAEGVFNFEAHSLTHPNLTRLTDEDCLREIVESKRVVEARLGRESRAFCYPGGFFAARERELVRKAGFAYGVTCEPGLNRRDTDPHLIRRIQIERTDAIRDFGAKVKGSHDLPLPGRQHYRRLRYGLRDSSTVTRKIDTASLPYPGSVLIASSYVLPHIGGVEQFVAVAAEDLREDGWSVRIVSSTLPDNQVPQSDVALPTFHLSATHHPVPYRGWLKLWREVGRSSVVVANQYRNLLPVITVLMARLRGRPAIFVVHGGTGIPIRERWWVSFGGRIFDQTLSRLAMRGAVITSLSDSGRELVQKNWRRESRYVPFPIRLQSPVDVKPLQPDEPVRAVWAGRLFPQKDPILAVHAVEVARRRRDIVLDMYGDGVLYPELAELARDRPWLVLHGGRTWQEIQDRQAAADFCFSSSKNEATCLAMLEPLARGIPVVTTAVGDIGRHLGDDLMRFTAPPGDPEALGNAIIRLCDGYDEAVPVFAGNRDRLIEHHRRGPDTLSGLIKQLLSAQAVPSGTGRVSQP